VLANIITQHTGLRQNLIPQAVYQPPSATGKKLSGIKNQFNHEQSFIPVTTNIHNNKIVSNDAAKSNTLVVDNSTVVNDASDDNKENTEDVNKTKDSITVSNKELNVIMSPVDEIQFIESEETLNNKEISDNSKGRDDNPLAKGNLATIEESNVKALQRRSFGPVSSPGE
jgi:hypothetical protein